MQSPQTIQSPVKKVPSSSPSPPSISTAGKDPRPIPLTSNDLPPSTDRKRRIIADEEDSYTSSSTDGGVPLNADLARPPVKKTKTNVENAGSAAVAPPKLKSVLKTPFRVNAETPSLASKSSTQAPAKVAPDPTPRPKPRTEATTKTLPQPQTAGETLTKTTPRPQAAAGPSQARKLKNAPADKPLTLNPKLVGEAPENHAVRLKLLTMLHQEYVRLHENKGDKQEMLRCALDEEETFVIQKRAIYAHAMKKRIVKLSRMSPAEFRQSVEEERAKKIIQVQSEDGNHAPALSTGKSLQEELDALRSMINSPKMLKAYGYILDPPTEGEIKLSLDGLKAASGWETCDRCNTRFQVYEGRRQSDGQLASGGKCTFHWGKLIFLQRTGSAYQDNARQKAYTCCRRVAGAPGCTTVDNHVFKVSEAKRLAASWPFIHTPLPTNLPAPTVRKSNANNTTSKVKQETKQDTPGESLVDKALCLDCEMCYTTHGMELIRITATAFPTGAIVIDALVRPLGEILDLNTRFSGVHPLSYSSAKPHTRKPYPTSTTLLNPCSTTPPNTALTILPSPEAARDLLLSYIDSDTPLIGHALENDLNALRLCHANVIDTAILFPHNRGIPARNKLKWLADVHLHRRIQVEGSADGHDSAVDARCAGELVRYKISGGLVVQ